MRYLTLFILTFLTACSHDRLMVRTDYLTQDDLASTWVNTPDPLHNQILVGQRLIIAWRKPRSRNESRGEFLNITIRFRNREQVEFSVPTRSLRGYYIYNLLNEDYCRLGGILTYKVELLNGNGCVLEDWRHQLWTELITIDTIDDDDDDLLIDFIDEN